MAAFAVHAGCAVLCRKLGVRIAFKLLGHLFMASGADFAANIRSLRLSVESGNPKSRCREEKAASMVTVHGNHFRAEHHFWAESYDLICVLAVIFITYG
jgi:hypothetical protein